MTDNKLKIRLNGIFKMFSARFIQARDLIVAQLMMLYCIAARYWNVFCTFFMACILLFIIDIVVVGINFRNCLLLFFEFILTITLSYTVSFESVLQPPIVPDLEPELDPYEVVEVDNALDYDWNVLRDRLEAIAMSPSPFDPNAFDQQAPVLSYQAIEALILRSNDRLDEIERVPPPPQLVRQVAMSTPAAAFLWPKVDYRSVCGVIAHLLY